jgi:hypothetical protein
MITSRLLSWTLPLAMMLALAGGAHAAVITLDGADSDWATSGVSWDNDDPNNDGGSTSTWDIDKNWDIFAPVAWDDGDKGGNSGTKSYYDFMVQMVGPWSAPTSQNDRLQVPLNTDMNNGTGTTLRGYAGADYYIAVTPSSLPNGPTSGTATLFKWTGAWTSIGSVVAARTSSSGDYWIYEVGVDPDLIWGAGGAPKTIQWAAYLTGDYTVGPFGYPNDHCAGVDAAGNPGPFTWKTVDIPEPGTTALFGMGLMGLLAFRRRKVQA